MVSNSRPLRSAPGRARSASPSCSTPVTGWPGSGWSSRSVRWNTWSRSWRPDDEVAFVDLRARDYRRGAVDGPRQVPEARMGPLEDDAIQRGPSGDLPGARFDERGEACADGGAARLRRRAGRGASTVFEISFRTRRESEAGIYGLRTADLLSSTRRASAGRGQAPRTAR